MPFGAALKGQSVEFSVQATLSYRVQQETPFVFNVQAQAFAGQTIKSESLRVEPKLPTEDWTMPESANRYFLLIAPAGDFKVTYQAAVLLTHPTENPADVLEVPPSQLPLSVLTHVYPSRYCQADHLDRFAERTFGNLPTGYQRVAAVCDWIHDNVDYVSGASDALTSAYDIVVQRAGVCRDFAHLGIAFCRALGVPVRYVSAYAWRLEPLDFHGVSKRFYAVPLVSVGTCSIRPEWQTRQASSALASGATPQRLHFARNSGRWSPISRRSALKDPPMPLLSRCRRSAPRTPNRIRSDQRSL
jgi:hypothetical protein